MNQLPAARPQTTVVANPFTSERKASNAVAATEESRAIAEIQGAVFMAKQFPRDSVQAVDRILNACTRPSLAEAALYSYSRGGSEITGPSIRLAEAMAQAWGNMAFGIQELDQRFGESTVQAYAWDLETNTRRVVTFQVPHIRYTKSGSKPLTDPRDIYEMVANQGARRLRACILSVIPGDVTEAAVQQCEVTMKSSADTSPDAIKKMVAAFSEFGVAAEQIAKRTQCRIEAIRPAQMVALRKIFSSLKDGMSVPEDWFEPLEITAPAALAKPEQARKPKAKPAAALASPPVEEQPPAPGEQAPPHDPETGEIFDQMPPELPLYDSGGDIAGVSYSPEDWLKQARDFLATLDYDEIDGFATKNGATAVILKGIGRADIVEAIIEDVAAATKKKKPKAAPAQTAPADTDDDSSFAFGD